MSERINLQRFFSGLTDSNLEYDLQQQLFDIAVAINELTEEIDAKRYSLLTSDD